MVSRQRENLAYPLMVCWNLLRSCYLEPWNALQAQSMFWVFSWCIWCRYLFRITHFLLRVKCLYQFLQCTKSSSAVSLEMYGNCLHVTVGMFVFQWGSQFSFSSCLDNPMREASIVMTSPWGTHTKTPLYPVLCCMWSGGAYRYYR